jgi:zinc protease
VLDEELANYLAKGPTREELDRIRTSNYAGFARGIERIDGFGGKSYILAESQVFGGSPDFYKTRLDWVASATPADVLAASRRWMSDGVFVLNVEPVKTYATTASTVDRSKLPTPRRRRSLPAPQRAKLSNGLEAVVERTTPHRGFHADRGRRLRGRFTGQIRNRATRDADAAGGHENPQLARIAERAESLGATLGVGSTLDRSYLSINALSSRLGDRWSCADLLLNSTFPDKELERLRGQTLATIQQEKAQPASIINRVAPKLLFGEGHAYANPSSGSGTEEAVSGLKSAELATFYKRWVRPDNSKLLVVGTTLAAIQPCSSNALAAGARPPRRCRRRTSPTWRWRRSRACSSSIDRAPSSRRSLRLPWRRRAPTRITSASKCSTLCSAAISSRAST